jgi:GTPase SAR1 family protein
MRPTFYKGSKAAIIVFSHTDEKSFDNITSWHEDIKKYTGELPIVLFGNKIDLINKEELEDQNIKDIVEEKGFLGYYKTSAKTGNGVYKAFQAIIKELYNKYKEE